MEDYGLSIVPAGVHGPQRRTRFTARYEPKANPYLRTDSRPYAEQVGVKRQSTTPRRCGETCAR